MACRQEYKLVYLDRDGRKVSRFSFTHTPEEAVAEWRKSLTSAGSTLLEITPTGDSPEKRGWRYDGMGYADKPTAGSHNRGE